MGGSGGGGGGQGVCERKIEVFVKIQKKNWRGGSQGGGGRDGGHGGQDGCERRIEVFCNFFFFFFFWGGGGRVGLGVSGWM